MAKINDGTLKDWKDGDKVTSDLYEADREILRVANNDNHDRITVLEDDKPVQDKRLDDLEYNVTGTVVPMTFKELGMQNLTFDDIKLGYVDQAIAKAWKPSLDGLTRGIVEEYTATNGQTVINLVNSYTPGSSQLTVEIDGVPQDDTSYTETSTTSITLSEALVAGQRVVVTIGKVDPSADARLSSLTTSLTEITDDYAVSLYVNSTTGSDTNDGLALGTPFKTLKKAFDVLRDNAHRMSKGTWTINLAAGTYTELDVIHDTPSKNRVVIQGVDVGGHPNVPTTIFDGTGGADYVHGIRISGIGVRASVRNIKFQNFTSNNTRIGLVGENESDLYAENVHANNCDWTGIYAFNTVRARVSGGILSNSRSGFVANDTEATIGYGGVGTIIQNCTESGIYWSRGSQGHADYCVFEDNAVGLLVAENSRLDTVACNFKRNVVGLRAKTGGVFGEGGSPNIFNTGTADANTTNIEYKAFSGDTTELGFTESYTRVGYDRTLRTVTGTTPTTLSTPYTIKANRLQGVGKQCRVLVLGVATFTAGSTLTVNFGGMSLALTVPAAGTSVTFELEVTLYEIMGGYRAFGSLKQGLSGIRLGTASSGFTNNADQTITVTATLAGASDTISIYRTDVYLMG
jgi:hypothetical protein